MRKQICKKIISYVTRYAGEKEILIGINPDSTLGRDILRQNFEINELRKEIKELKQMVNVLNSHQIKKNNNYNSPNNDSMHSRNSHS